MSFLCQRESYLQEHETVVKSCQPSTLSLVQDGKKEKIQGFNVLLEDTILFPEGGGQPDDRGTINGMPVLRITRVGAESVNFVQTEILKGTSVSLKVDWKRRFEHMQVHTAQHLITAVTDKKFGYQTTSWCIGTDITTIELDTPTMSVSQIAEVEEHVNECIRNCVSVTPIYYQDKDDPELAKFRARGLPDDHVGPVRVLIIDGIDSTLCCGTHVSNLSHIQAIKLLGVEKGKKGKVNLSFLAGNRLLNYIGDSFDRERTLTGILKVPAVKHCELADKAVKGQKLMQKNCNTQLRELATLEAKLYRLEGMTEGVFVKHRKDGDNDYMSILLAELSDVDVPKLITIGDEKESGNFTLAGGDQLLKELGPQICDILGGKGAPSKGVFRGKATKLASRGKAEQLLKDYINKQTNGDVYTVTDKES